MFHHVDTRKRLMVEWLGGFATTMNQAQGMGYHDDSNELYLVLKELSAMANVLFLFTGEADMPCLDFCWL